MGDPNSGKLETFRSYPDELGLYCVRIRLPNAKTGLLPAQGVLFTDNIIVLRDGPHIRVHGLFKVKAGYKGNSEARKQIFDWIEEKLEWGSQVVVPEGASIIDQAGIATKVTKELKFNYGKRPGIGEGFVYNLTNAKRHVVLAKGISYVGVRRSADNIAAQVVPHNLNRTSAEIDYLIRPLKK
ncbi:hypothetical protein B0T16DRAFT_517946 [Cercophora newfieldiana]|uniref:Uncharacterized protein n=1 Tax=Cercophora newfieldiana TaxID=92897 RepID=A0AA40CJA0_9PEZI|nr:hypothetical protein B0T16DRAFT_517946 [Cercophora newfieldiana]